MPDILSDRAVIALTGPEAKSFLQGLVTNDVTKVAPGAPAYAALLSAQGKILFDFLVHQDGEALLIDCLAAARPALIAFALSSTSFHWNDFLWPLIVTNSATSRPLTVGLSVLTQLGEIGAQWPLVTAGTVIVVGPLLVLFLIFQRQFIESFLHSGLK